jgi:hypothetical protein
MEFQIHVYPAIWIRGENLFLKQIASEGTKIYKKP